jgi:hypothetical protein
MTPPEAASPLPPRGAPPAAWQSQSRGGPWARPLDARNLSLRISGHS